MGADEPTTNIKKEDYLQKFIPDQFNFFKNNSKNRFWNKNNKNYINNKNKKTKNIKVYIKEFNHNFDNLFASIVFLIRKNNDCNYLCKQSKYQKKYDPPNNINLNKIQKFLKEWMSYVDEESKIIYQGMINVLSSLNNSVFDKKFRAISQKYNYARMAPKKISSFAGGIYYYNHQRCQEAKNKYMKNGKIISSLNINQNYKDDKNAENLLKYVKNNELNIQNRYDDYK